MIVDKTKSQLEQHRIQRAMRGDDTGGGRMDDTESDLKDTMEHAKRGLVSLLHSKNALALDYTVSI